MESDAFSIVLTIFSRKTLEWSISILFNLMKEDQML